MSETDVEPTRREAAEYGWRGYLHKVDPAFPQTPESARAVHAELERLRSGLGRMPTPEQLVRAAERGAAGAVHPAFTWDDAAAAHARRLEQARDLMGGLRVVHVTFYDDTERRSRPLPVYQSFPMDGETRSYRDVALSLTRDDERVALLRQLLVDLRQLERRYRTLAEAGPTLLAAILRVRGLLEREGAAEGPAPVPPAAGAVEEHAPV